MHRRFLTMLVASLVITGIAVFICARAKRVTVAQPRTTNRSTSPGSDALAEFHGSGIRLRYPKNWKAIPFGEEGETSIIRLMTPAIPRTFDANLQIKSGRMPAGGTSAELEKVAEGLLAQQFRNLAVNERSSRRVANVNASVLVGAGRLNGEQLTFMNVLFVKGGTAYDLLFLCTDAEYDEDKEAVNAIVKSIEIE